MLGILLTFFRYLFLLLLYIFIFQLARMMFKGYREYTILAEHGSPSKIPGKAAGSGLKITEPDPEPVPGVEACLVVLASPDRELSAGAVFTLDREAVLGRSRDNEVVIPDPFASSEHARIFKKDGQFWLEDLSSSNGTFLNETRVQKPTVLADRDRIRIGGLTLKFVRWAYEVESGH